MRTFYVIIKLLYLIVTSPLVTFRLLSWKRIKNFFRALYLDKGNWGLLLHRYAAIYSTGYSADFVKSIEFNGAKKGDIIYFPPIDWHFRYQRPQHLAREFAERGFRVFYISTTPVISGTRKNYEIKGMPHPGVVLIELSTGSNELPDLNRNIYQCEQQLTAANSISVLQRDLQIKSPYVFIQHPFWWPITNKIKAKKVIYDCLDYHPGFNRVPYQKLQEVEQDLINNADEIIVTSKILGSLINQTRTCHLVRNGCEFELFNNQKKNRVFNSVPLIGYVGALGEWFDASLMHQVAIARPHWDFEFYGAVRGADVSLLKNLANVKFHGEIDYEKVPEVLTKFDVGIIPFKINKLTLATNPVKLYEYLAVGCPVVSTRLPEVSGLAELDVFCASDLQDFIGLLERAITVSCEPERILARKKFACAHDWSQKAEDIIKLLDK